MKKILMIIISLVLFSVFSLDVYASECDNEDLNRLRELSKRITYEYEYYGALDLDSNTQTYKVYFENLGDDFFVSIDEKNEVIFYDDRQTESVSSGKRVFRVLSKKCGTSVNMITIDLPKFNDFSLSFFCDEHSDLDYCYQWYPDELTESDIDRIINEYDQDDEDITNKIKDVFLSYYYIIVPAFIFFLIILIILLRKKINSGRLE